MRRFPAIAFFAFGLIPATQLSAQTKANSAVRSSSSQAPAQTSGNPCEILERNDITPTTPYVDGLDNDVTLVLRDLSKCLEQGHVESDLRVFLDGTMLPKLPPSPSPDQQNYVKFTLRMDPFDKDDRARWAKIIRAMRRSSEGVTFTVGDSKAAQPFTSDQRIVINLYPRYTAFVVAGLIVLLMGLIVLGIKSNLLRDNPAGETSSDAIYPISLGRVQMAWWFYLVIAGYPYLWLITGVSYTPTGSVLALLGISSATGFAGAIVDRSKNSDATSKRSELEVQISTLNSRIAEIEATHPLDGSDSAKDLAAKKDEIKEATARMALVPRLSPSTSKGLFRDLFCDGDGVSFHRFQIIVWTIVLGVVFINAVHSELAMPDFDPTLLGLMGLSSGTYLGFKFPEKPK